MNRVHHVSKTLPANLKQNQERDVNFILLDYHSTDGLEEYIQSNYKEEIESGKLTYYRYVDAKSFKRAHSRNMALKLADGEILCNVDADNYAGEGFGAFVQTVYQQQQDICLTGLGNKWMGDASGKLCVEKSQFLKVTGYDEAFEEYGFEDYDIVNRLGLSGCEAYTVNRPEYLYAIQHERKERLINEESYKHLYGIYVRFIDHSTSEIVFLYNNQYCIHGTIVNNFTSHCDDPNHVVKPRTIESPKFSIINGWNRGSWEKLDSGVRLSVDGKEKTFQEEINNRQSLLKNANLEYYMVTDLAMKLEAISFLSEFKNRSHMLSNLANKRIRVNETFGRGIVYKNFNYQEPIEI
jgi:GT2 family glycosyltransferase